MNTITERIKEAVDKIAPKHKDVADLLGIHQVQLSRILHEDRKPSVKFIIRLCKASGYSADYLLGLIDEPLEAWTNGYHAGKQFILGDLRRYLNEKEEWF